MSVSIIIIQHNFGYIQHHLQSERVYILLFSKDKS